MVDKLVDMRVGKLKVSFGYNEMYDQFNGPHIKV